MCGTVCRLTFKGTDVERASLKLAARRTSEMSLEGFICFHPQMLCNKGFKDVLWTGWSLDSVLFIYLSLNETECGYKKRMKICFFVPGLCF